MPADPFGDLRRACEAHMAEARFVHIDGDGAARLAETYQREALERGSSPGAAAPGAAWDVETHFRGVPEDTLAYILILDTLNFGSGWFPLLRKRPGRSGYYCLAMGLKERFEEAGPLGPASLCRAEAPVAAALWGQPEEVLGDPALVEFFELQARALRDLGTLVELAHGGRFSAFREAAGRSAASLVGALARMPLFRDVALTPTGRELRFFKRAQIAVADLAAAFDGATFGAFDDLADLTAFADNTLPNVLRGEGVLHYAPTLADAIDRGEPLASGSPQEVELRAATVHAVELVCAAARTAGARDVEARRVDAWLWQRGQAPRFKATPRHRTRCAFY